MSIPLFAMIPDAHKDTVNAVLAVLASGMENITAPYAHKDDPTTITQWVMLDMGASQSRVDEFAALQQGIVPTLTGSLGEDGLPTHAELMDAVGGGNLKVVPGYGYGYTQGDIEEFMAGIRIGNNIVPWNPGI